MIDEVVDLAQPAQGRGAKVSGQGAFAGLEGGKTGVIFQRPIERSVPFQDGAD